MSSTTVTIVEVRAKPINPLLASYLAQLALHPLRTKAFTTATLCFLQEVLATHFAGVPAKKPSPDAPLYHQLLARSQIDTKALKMAVYGFFISAPMGHYLVGALQKAFAGKTSTAAKIGQILANNLLVAPIQASVYLASMAVINGAKTKEEVVKTVKSGFMAVMRMTWITSPLTLVFAQQFLSPELWVPFFNIVGFVLGTYFNTKVKQIRLAAEKKKDKDPKDA
ncbi:hypothetical protein GLOTRDRAFT_68255 [Gloeophyllum trabeum ATCC 11539]|uniref:Integral membrane protein n=1 Tax=Gloeophyllum trabeum (strain ATCC 11539 / FP-39264 / Madison 617) TaxID=670483 RepID=S7S3X8_GLOTA|nr:uncharacterized protein GLOTRDRAFT_68255 [Gloeophyllum trabeum ATCC 11539]EPQ60534.1 hypothetical protein GLOTRDRAFT_68255 [Gloeophyllum trabeum ATCC 11539]